MNWPIASLADATELLTDGTHYTPPDIGEGIPFLTVKDVGSNSLDFIGCSKIATDEYEAARKQNSAPRFGDVLFSKDGTVGKVHLVQENRPFAVLSSLAILRPSKHVDGGYLAHFLRTPSTIDAATKKKTGSAIRRIVLRDLATLEIPLPPLDQQRRIAAILDKADALRRKRRRTLDLLDSLTRSIFLEVFGDPVSNPKKLNKITLGDLIKVKSGNGLVAKDMAPGGLFPVYGGNGINGYHDRFMFDEPQLAIGRVGVYCGAVHLTKPKSWVTDNALYVSEYKKPVSQLYLRYALVETNLNQYAGRAAQPLISGSRIYPIEIILPSKGDQTRFEKAIMQVSHLEIPYRADAELVNAAFSSLQSRAFSGQL
ncbi:MAG: type I restriction modification enzyme, S subunit [Nitrobacter sp.]|uniref:restriction endonuclease subunit S n=1 Tax=Nitrobacter sp. TaxID=29420 RepID=UPI00387DFBB8